MKTRRTQQCEAGAPRWRGPCLTETQVHRAVVAHLQFLGRRGLVWWHTPNGGSRNRAESVRVVHYRGEEVERLDNRLPLVHEEDSSIIARVKAHY